MKPKLLAVFLVAVILAVSATPVYAGVFDVVKGWFSWGAIALILSGLLGLGTVVKYTSYGSRVCIALGAFFTSIGIGLSDGKISGDELKEWLADYRALVAAIKSGWGNG